jgi:predicted glycoside hydrolase/deacetylase ChbG (UPF0249 family)
LAERLGYSADSKLLIINCDDLGSSLAANVGIYQAMRDGIATSASLMVPCPSAQEAAATCRNDDVGVHLTLNSEWARHRWAPVTEAPSLRDLDGNFLPRPQDTFEQGIVEEIHQELRAQLKRALSWGIDVTHIDSHMGTLLDNRAFFEVFLSLAVEFDLPIRAPGSWSEAAVGFSMRQLAADAGVLLPDNTRSLSKALAIRNRRDGRRLQRFVPVRRVSARAAFARVVEELERDGVVLIGYRELRDLQRAERERTESSDVYKGGRRLHDQPKA